MHYLDVTYFDFLVTFPAHFKCSARAEISSGNRNKIPSPFSGLQFQPKYCSATDEEFKFPSHKMSQMVYVLQFKMAEDTVRIKRGAVPL